MTTSSAVLPAAPQRPLLPILGGILLALGAPLIAYWLNGYFAVWFDNNGRVLAGLLFFLLMSGLVILLTRAEPEAAHTRAWRRIGLQPVTLRTTLIILILGFITLFGVNVAFVILSRTIFPTEITTSAALRLPPILIVLAFLIGSTTEEVLYRGYALERLQRITGNWWISGGITCALFVVLHMPAYPMAHIVGYVLPAAVVVTLVYIWKRNLSYCILLHLVLNFPLLLAALILAILPA